MEESISPNPSKTKPESQDTWRFTAELFKTALVVLVIAYVIRVFVMQPFIVEGLSMFPQLHDKDYLLVDKLSYRFHEARRGDVVVFRSPKDLASNYVKRVIGLPGEKIKIENSKVYIINKEHPEGMVLDEPYVQPGNKTMAGITTENGEFSVPEDSYFVLGDNRMGSADSRNWGELPKRDMIGRVLVLAYPFDRVAISPHADYGL